MCLGLLIASMSLDIQALTIDEPSIDFGEQYQFTNVTREIRVWNETLVPIRLNASAPVGKWPKLQFDNALLEAGSSTLAHIELPLTSQSGAITVRFPFESESNGKIEQHEIVVSGYVDSILDDPRPAIDFGVVDARAPIEKSISISSGDEPDVHITKVLEQPNFLSAHVDDPRTLRIVPSKVDVLGFNKGVVKVALDSNRQGQAWITVLMDIHGDVVPDQNPVDFGVQRVSSRRSVRLQLTSRTGRKFSVGKVRVDAAHVKIEPAKCLTISEGCHAFSLMVDSDHSFGEIVGKVAIELPDSHQTLDVHLGGIFLADGTPLLPLDKQKQGKSTSKTDAQPSLNVAQSLKKATSAEAEMDPPGVGPLIKWQVGNEAAIYGYVIYRADSAEGKFKRVNEQIVKAKNGGDNTTADYKWRDTSAIKGREYWYYITIFNNDGRKTQLTGPQRVVAK
jgi:hypothetical protein